MFAAGGECEGVVGGVEWLSGWTKHVDGSKEKVPRAKARVDLWAVLPGLKSRPISEATAATQKYGSDSEVRQRLGRKGSDKDQGVGAKGAKVATFRHVIGANVWGDAERSRSQRE